MAIQLTWDTFSTFEPNYDSNINKTAGDSQVPVLASLKVLSPVIPVIEQVIVQTVETLAQTEYILPDVSRFEEYLSMKSLRSCDADPREVCTLPEITFDIESSPNKGLWKMVLHNTKECFNVRSHILDSYKSLGQTVKIEGDRGLADMARRREANFAQFFTLKEIVQFVTAALGLDRTDRK